MTSTASTRSVPRLPRGDPARVGAVPRGARGLRPDRTRARVPRLGRRRPGVAPRRGAVVLVDDRSARGRPVPTARPQGRSGPRATPSCSAVYDECSAGLVGELEGGRAGRARLLVGRQRRRRPDGRLHLPPPGPRGADPPAGRRADGRGRDAPRPCPRRGRRRRGPRGDVRRRGARVGPHRAGRAARARRPHRHRPQPLGPALHVLRHRPRFGEELRRAAPPGRRRVRPTADAVVAGAAADLDAWLWKRRERDGIEVSGDEAAFAALLEAVSPPLD